MNERTPPSARGDANPVEIEHNAYGAPPGMGLSLPPDYLNPVGEEQAITLADEWGERRPRTRIVAIGTGPTLERDALRAAIEQCVGPAEAAT